MMKDIKVTATIKHNNIKTSGKVGFIREVDTAEPYEGPYDVTVVNSQVLPTNGKRMTGDVTVRQGAETYTGATTVSVEASDVVVNTMNKLMPSNITVKQGFERYRGPYQLTLDNYGTHVLTVKDKYCDQNIQVTQPYTRYTGPMTINVTESVVKVFANEWINGVVFINQAIPLYEGQTYFEVADGGITIEANGKRFDSDITIDISDLEALAEEISEVVG